MSREKGDTMVSFYHMQDLGITFICREEGATSSTSLSFFAKRHSFGLVTSAKLAKNGRAKGMIG